MLNISFIIVIRARTLTSDRFSLLQSLRGYICIIIPNSNIIIKAIRVEGA
jgi:hypothetical protein